MRNKKLLIIIFCFIIILLFTFYKLNTPQNIPITATGTVEVTKIEITPRLNGYIRELKIDTGYRIKSGERLFKIDRVDLIEQLNADKYALLQSQAKLKDLESGARTQEIIASTAILKSNQAILTTASLELERYQQLYAQQAIAKQQLDNIQKSYDIALNAVANSQAQLTLLKEGNREDQIAAQRAEVLRYQAIIAANKSILKDTELNSSLDGIILSRNFENNEYVAAGAPVLTIADLQDCWIKIYIASNDLGKISLGQKALVKVDSFPTENFIGQVKEIADKAEFTPRQSVTKNERTNMVFAVKVKLDNSSEKLKPGMPADVIFE